MKESNECLIAIQDLVVDGVYETHTRDLVKIKGINKDKNELHVYNMTESCNVYMNLARHLLKKRIR